MAAALLAAMTATSAGALPQAAWAEESAEAVNLRKAEALATEAKFMFQQKLYAEAAEKFFEAYTLAKRGTLIFNAARAHEEAKNYAKSIAYFRAYLGQPDVTPDGKKDAEARIARMEAELKAQRDAQEARDREAARLAEEQRRKEEDQRRKEEAAKADAQRKLDDARKRDEARKAEEAKKADAAAKAAAGVAKSVDSRTFPLVPAVATGGALVLTAVSYGLALSEAGAARDMESKVVNSATKKAYLDKVDSAYMWRNVAIGGGVITAGLAGWAAWTWYQSGGKRAASWQLTPGPGDAGLGLVGHF